MNRYSIVLQGALSGDNLPCIKHARLFSDDVVVSTWESYKNTRVERKLDELGVRVVYSQDPGSAGPAYEQYKVTKPLNVARQTLGALTGIRVAIKDDIIRSRIDCTLDYDKAYEVWSVSGKKFGAANASSICPFRIFSYPYLFHISDWCHVGRRENFIEALEAVRDPIALERDIASSTGVKCGDMSWFSKLAPEQVITLILAKYPAINKLKIKKNIKDYTPDEIILHNKVLSDYCNLNIKDIDLKSAKYRLRANRWLCYDRIDFSDSQAFKNKPLQLMTLIAFKFKMLWR